MREGLLAVSMMAAVVATTAVVSAVSPGFLGTHRVPNDPGQPIVIPGPVPTMPTPSPVNDAPSAAPTSVSEVPAQGTYVPVPTKSASPTVSPDTPPPLVPPIPNPPPPNEPCPVGLALNPLLGVCVVI